MTKAAPPTIDDILEALLDREGRGERGWVNDPADRGGPTNHGITLQKLSEIRRRAVTIDELRRLTDEEAKAIYLDDFVKRPRFDRIADAELRALVVDAGVHHGQGTATVWLQQAVDVTADGVFGPKTEAAVNAADPEVTFLRVAAQRLRKMGRIVTNDPKESKFMAGWADRLADFLDDNRF